MKKDNWREKEADRYFELWQEFLKQGMHFGEALFKAQEVLRKKKKFQRDLLKKK